MNEIVEFLVHHGYSVLFLWVLGEQAGLPIPSAPVLLAAGALAGTGRMNLPIVVATALIAATICDTLWYILGRQRGSAVLRFICRISLEPDSCVRRTRVSFERRGAWALVIAKFVPGLSAMTAPLAGTSRMPWQRFAFYDAIGACYGPARMSQPASYSAANWSARWIRCSSWAADYWLWC